MLIADVDGDGKISFSEFFFFVLVNQTPSRNISADFRKKGGELTVDEFAKCLTTHRKKT